MITRLTALGAVIFASMAGLDLATGSAAINPELSSLGAMFAGAIAGACGGALMGFLYEMFWGRG